MHRSFHIPQLDGLRGVAILLVVSQHYFGFLPFFSFGWAGLDLFFVLSGYLITGRLQAKRRDPGYFSNFYRNRALRILPLYYAALILFFTAIHFLAKKESLPLFSYYTIHWKSFFMFTQNWTFIIYGLPTAIYLLHFWSLAVEEQFYLVWPAIIYILANYRSRILLCMILPPAAIIIRIAIFFFHPGDGTAVNILFNTLCRMDAFAIGALLCEIHHAKIRIPQWVITVALFFSVAALTLSGFFFHNMAPNNPFFSTLGTTCTAILCGCLLQRSLASPVATGRGSFTIARVLNLRVLRFFGRISYGLYIIHFPIFLLLYKRFYDWGTDSLPWMGPAMQITAACTCLLISLVLSIISFRYFESFFLRLKRR
jgi:peptidoglycan/LPS O-acetylase OafA/YrhL